MAVVMVVVGIKMGRARLFSQIAAGLVLSSAIIGFRQVIDLHAPVQLDILGCPAVGELEALVKNGPLDATAIVLLILAFWRWRCWLDEKRHQRWDEEQLQRRRDEKELQRRREQERKEQHRRDMENALVNLLDEFGDFNTLHQSLVNDGIMTLAAFQGEALRLISENRLWYLRLIRYRDLSDIKTWYSDRSDYDQLIRTHLDTTLFLLFKEGLGLKSIHAAAVQKLRRTMDTSLVDLLDEFSLFDKVATKLFVDGITTVTILAGRNAGGGGGIQPQRLERDYGIAPGVAVALKQRAIASLPRPNRSPARARAA